MHTPADGRPRGENEDEESGARTPPGVAAPPSIAQHGDAYVPVAARSEPEEGEWIGRHAASAAQSKTPGGGLLDLLWAVTRRLGRRDPAITSDTVGAYASARTPLIVAECTEQLPPPPLPPPPPPPPPPPSKLGASYGSAPHEEAQTETAPDETAQAGAAKDGVSKAAGRLKRFGPPRCHVSAEARQELERALSDAGLVRPAERSAASYYYYSCSCTATTGRCHTTQRYRAL